MPRYEVIVRATWEGDTPFEFDSKQAAADFKRAVDKGDLKAIVDAGDITSANVSLIDFEAAGPPREARG